MSHEHTERFRESYPKDQETLDYHPKLVEWIHSVWKMPPEMAWVLVESGCDDGSCPVVETVIRSENGQMLKITRRRDQITKQDFVFAVQRQGIWRQTLSELKPNEQGFI